jgi:histone-binding protein RBBP4
MPQSPHIIATKTISGEVHIFDWTKHRSQPEPGAVPKPDIRLRGHTKEGYGLAWNALRQGYLLSGADDKLVCCWDVRSYTAGKNTLDALYTFSGHTSVVGDVAWQCLHDSIFASVGDDQKLMLWDLRSSNTSQPKLSVTAHQGEVNAVAFNPSNEFILATGGNDKVK